VATIKRPRGRMTKPLVTPYEVGDVVLFRQAWFGDDYGKETGSYIGSHGDRCLVPRVGDIGVIEQIVVANDCDGDDANLLFKVQWSDFGSYYFVGAEDIASLMKGAEWLRRQLATLDVEGEAP
jgi:hypothetical protein